MSTNYDIPFNAEPTIRVNGSEYFSKTDKICKTCTLPDRYLYLKMVTGNTAILECPYCTTVVPVPKGS